MNVVEPFAVMTVCTGNVCRSPMAERLLAAKFAELAADGWPGWKPGDGILVTSAGTAALVGDPMPAEAAELTRAAGGDPDGHAARQLEVADLESVGLVLAMTRVHRRESVTMKPKTSRVTFTLLEFARLIDDLSRGDDFHLDSTEPAKAELARLVDAVAMHRGFVPPPAGVDADDVIDPYRRPLAVYEQSATQISTAIAVIFDSIRRLAAAG
ncbi:MAG: low molecular weight phosphatase family protein [Microbacteriaceae bacterium]|nr:low molecular weight phosphatase family protein [Microbacteriaceae bacterium]